jgi:hypothetical protein
MGLRITHAMRFSVQDKTKDMTPEERTAYYNRRRTDDKAQAVTPEHLSDISPY